MKYVLRLCEIDYNGGRILEESVHDTFDAAMDAIPSPDIKFDARRRADIKATLDSVGAWDIYGIGDLVYVIHTQR